MNIFANGKSEWNIFLLSRRWIKSKLSITALNKKPLLNTKILIYNRLVAILYV